MRVILGRLSTRYSGRIDAELELGDACVLLRLPELGGDGSAAVFSMSAGLSMRNWMPSNSTTVERPGGYDIVHEARGERLEIFIDEIYSQVEHVGGPRPDLLKLGAEREVSDLLADRVDLLGQGLELVGREVRTPVGAIDLLLKDEAGTPIPVEVKRVKVSAPAVYQLLRYIQTLPMLDEWADAPEPRGILVAPSIAKTAKALVDGVHIRYVRLGYEQLIAGE